MRVAIVVYILLVALVAFNVAQVFEFPSWIAAPVVLVAIGVIAITHFAIRSSQALYVTLSAISVVSLVVVSFTASLPAFAVIDNGSSLHWTSSLIPLFVSAIGLYGVGLWLRAASASQADALDWLANFLSGPGLLLSLLTALVLSATTLLALEWLGETWTTSKALSLIHI